MKTRSNKILGLLLCCLLLGACIPMDHSAKGLGHERSTDLNGIRYSCRLNPPYTNNPESDRSINEKIQKEKAPELKQLTMTLIISDMSSSEHAVKEAIFAGQSFSSLLSYANSELQYDFELELPGGELLPCSGVHMEAANSIQPVIRISAAFPDFKPQGDIVVVFHDKLFNNGKIKFRFQQKVLGNLPQLNI